MGPSVRARDGAPYAREDYRLHGAARYESTFYRYLGRFNILLQTPYWDTQYPRQLSREQLRQYRDKLPYVIGDISCDIDGSLACTLRESSIDDPAYTYLPETHETRDGISWDGPTIMAISHLPCQLAIDASNHFSKVLSRFIPEIVAMDLSRDLAGCGLSRELQKATIVYRGELTPGYAYLEDHLRRG